MKVIVDHASPSHHDRVFGFKEPPSPIVQKAEACGAGALSGTSSCAVQDWFGKHRGLRRGGGRECANQFERKRPAQWTDSTEGRVCVAARNIAQWVRKPSGRPREVPVRLEVVSDAEVQSFNRQSAEDTCVMWQKINKHRQIIHLVLGAAVCCVILSPLARRRARLRARS